MRTKFLLPTALVVAVTVLLSGCSGLISLPTHVADKGGKDSKAAALLPAKYANGGSLTVAIDPSFPPNESKGSSGKLVGWEVDLINTIGTRLGVKIDFQTTQADSILAGVSSGKYDLAISSLKVTKAGEKTVNFLDYYHSGIQWAAPQGKKVDPTKACGLTVAVQTGTIEETTGVPAKSKACTTAHKKAITVAKYDSANAAAAAVTQGKADALAADVPVTGYQVAQSGGALALAGDAFAPVSYGIAFGKKSGDLQNAILAGLTSAMDYGSYLKILKKWGVDSGAVTIITENGATS